MAAVGSSGENAAAGALATVRHRIAAAERRFHRPPGSVRLLAVSKTKPAASIRDAYDAGQRAFGENYAQEATEKMDALPGLEIEWHFIGPVQANKTRIIARRFHWVHSVDRLKVARRLNDQRPEDLPPLEVCVEVNLSEERSKAGIYLDELPDFARAVSKLPRLRLRGLMGLPQPEAGFAAQRLPFRTLRLALANLNDGGLGLDTLSMGMTDDMEAAIAEGATVVRIGTAIFGPRGSRPPPHGEP